MEKKLKKASEIVRWFEKKNGVFWPQRMEAEIKNKKAGWVAVIKFYFKFLELCGRNIKVERCPGGFYNKQYDVKLHSEWFCKD
jgi:hypothetical protein